MSQQRTPTVAATSPTNCWDPAFYNHRAAFVSQAASDLIDWLEPRPGEAILDLGCGTGELGTAIAARGARVVGLDASAEMIAVARERAPALEWLIGDGEALAFDGAFDAIFSNAALHWMTHAQATARGIARALKPGGRLVAEFGGAGCVGTVCAAVASELVARGDDPARWLRWYFPTIAAYATVLEAAELEPRTMTLFERPTRLSGADGLRDWLQIFLAPLTIHLGAGWPAFVAAVEACCRPRLFDGTDWILDYVRLRLRALKPAQISP
jgi:trans-aconitate methyltransferase